MPKKIRIGMDARPLSTKMSGVGRLLSEILKAFPDKNLFEIHLFSHKPIHPDHSILSKEPHLLWHEEGGFWKWKGGVYYNLYVPFLLRKLNLDLFWGSQQVLPPFLPKKLPAVLTYCDLVLYKYPETMRWVARLQQRFFQRYSVLRSSFILSISKSTSDDVVKFFEYPENQTDVTYPAVNADELKQLRDRAKSKKMEFLPQKYLLSVSTIEPRKNYPFLFAVFKLLSQRNPDLHWVIVGKIGWESMEFIQELQDFATKTQRISILDSVSDEDLIPIYDRASAFAFASQYEGFGIPLLEAMHLGLPSVVSDIPTFREIGGDKVCYLQTKTNLLSDWVSALETALTSPKISYDTSVFTWKKAAQRTADCFQKVLRRFL